MLRAEVMLQEIVVCARRGEYPDAASKLNAVLQLIQPILTSGTIEQGLIQKLSYSLETLCMVQQQKDWVAVADVIEFEFVALLKQGLPGKEE